jgi:5-methylcytosine-specific restriction endonuclease McrA|tara:strand:- start:652 stop:1170 length:519 start_codon:yes stop_codon:yes gene_type:complete
MDREVLLLNASEEVLNVIDWKKAVALLESGKAIQPYSFSRTYKIKTPKGTYPLPLVLVLLKYVLTPHQSHLPTRKNIFKRDKWTCQYCGKKSKSGKVLTIDHVTPSSRGGDSSWTNLTTACSPCNTKKGNKKPKECKMPLISKPIKPKHLEMELAAVTEELLKIWKRWIQHT